MKDTDLTKKRIWYVLAFLIIISLIFFAITYIESKPQVLKEIEHISQKDTKKYHGDIPVLVLSGTYYEMGVQYGKALKPQLKEILAILTDYYITQKHLTYKQLDDQATLLYNRFPAQLQPFLEGIATGSELNISDVKILNAMETLGALLAKPQAACAFLSIPGSKTTTGTSLIGRNYDYSAPFDRLAKYLTVTILKQQNKIPTAFIGIAGEAYCPTCINAQGIFMELNNGMPSGGTKVNLNASTMLANMLITLQNANTLDQVSEQLKGINSDFSLIVNAAQKGYLLSLEFSTNDKLKNKRFSPSGEQPFVSTNYFLNNAWDKSIPNPTDENTWLGVSRRSNLINLINKSMQLNVAKLQQLMDIDITHGGGRWNHTIYQLVFDESDLSLYIKILGEKPTGWLQIPLNDFFN